MNLEINRSKKIKKPVSIRQIEKNISRSKILFQLDSYLLKNKKVSLEIPKIMKEQNLYSNKKISDFSLVTNLSKEVPSQVFDKYFVDEKMVILKKKEKVVLSRFENLKKILKNYFFHKTVFEEDLENLSISEKKILSKILKVQNESDFNKIKIQNTLNNYFDKFLTNNFQSKILNFTRKLYKQVNKRIFKKFINKNKNKITGTEYLNKYLNFYFNNPKEELKLIINYCLFELKKKDVIVIFAFHKYTKKFDFELDQLFEEKWNFLIDDIQNFFDQQFLDAFLQGIRNKIAECSVIGFSTKYFKEVYEILLV